MPRTPVQSDLGRVRLNPAAGPVDTFVQRNAGAGLSQLAEGLKAIAPAVAQFSDIQAERQNKVEQARGEQKAREYADSGKSYRDAIKNGVISKSESPWFQLGAKEQYGRVAAGRYNDDLNRALDADPAMSQTPDAKKFDAFERDFRKKWLDTNVGDENRDLHFEHGFGTLSDALTNDTRRSFTAQAGNRLEKYAENNQYAELFQHFDKEITAGTSHDAIAEGVNIITQRAVSTGQDPRIVNAATIKSLSDIVRSTGDTSLFDILKKVSTSQGNNLWGTAAAQKEIRESDDYVAVDKQNKAVADRELHRALVTEQTHTIYGRVINRLMSSSNPSAEDITDDVKEMAKVSPADADNLIRFKATATGAHFDSNQQVVNDTLVHIVTASPGSPDYVTAKSLARLVTTGSINQQDFAFLNAQVNGRDDKIRQAENAGKGGDSGPYKDPIFRDALVTLRAMFGGENDDYDVQKSERRRQAQAEFVKRWLDYANGAGVAATEEQNNVWLTREQNRISKKFLGKDDSKPAEGVTKADLGQQYLKVKMISPRLLNRMELEFKSASGPSAETIVLFQKYNIPPEEIGAFFRAQRSLYNSQ